MDKDDKSGFFTWPTLYRDMVSRFPDGSVFVEVGLFKGESLSFLLKEIEAQKKQIDVVGVDSFFGYWDKYKDVFLRNIAEYDFRFIHRESIDAAKLFGNCSVDFVFIDADHSYESVKEDIEAWFPKVKSIIAGHDYIPSYPGVMQAVDERFEIDETYIHEGCWLYEKTKEDE